MFDQVKECITESGSGPKGDGGKRRAANSHNNNASLAFPPSLFSCQEQWGTKGRFWPEPRTTKQRILSVLTSANTSWREKDPDVWIWHCKRNLIIIQPSSAFLPSLICARRCDTACTGGLNYFWVVIYRILSTPTKFGHCKYGEKGNQEYVCKS